MSPQGRPQPLMPFRMAARQRRQKQGVIPFAASSTAPPLVLQQVGLLNGLIIQVRGNATYSAGGVFPDLGPHNIISRLRVTINLGSANLFDTTGYGAFLISSYIERSFRTDRAGAGNLVPDPDVFDCDSTGGGVKPVVLTYFVPIALNNGVDFQMGLLNLQAPELRANVEISWGAVTDIQSTCTAFVGNAHVYAVYYEIPDPTLVQLPKPMLVRTIEESVPVTNLGDQVYQIPRLGTVLQMAQYLRVNGARNNNATETEIRINRSDVLYKMERQFTKVIQRLSSGVEWPTGVLWHDFWHAMGMVSAGDFRDTLDTEAISTIEFITRLDSSVVLGANNNNLNFVRRVVQPFEY